ncbi:PLC-like phosphodiesterase [Rhodocollybia butyracea]|uniref:Phosphoinositide phospholipase C n=1 Tax=Rhodocollybia butyracea TaxID=206335 RepID=A0A9P5U852_9AGAR|nr:PLC-like phosphodiesterase [Rhodocollybia butyracea]
MEVAVKREKLASSKSDDREGPGAILRRHSVNVGRSIKRKMRRVLTRSSVSYPADKSTFQVGATPRKSLTLEQSTPPWSGQQSSQNDNVALAYDSLSMSPGPLNESAQENVGPLDTDIQLFTTDFDEPPTEDPRPSPASPVFNDSITTESLVDPVVPQILQQGTPLLKVSNKKQKLSKLVFKIDADQGRVVWESKVHKFISVENIKEIRTGQAAVHHITQLQRTPVEDYLPLWLTLIYIAPVSSKARSKTGLSPLPLASPKSYSANTYKTLHLIASSPLVVQLWERTLTAMIALRVSLTRGLGFGGGVNTDRAMEEVRTVLWERSFWTAAGEKARGLSSRPVSRAGSAVDDSLGSPGAKEEQRLTFIETRGLCERLNLRMSEENVRRLFDQADNQKRGFLDFEGFRRFGKLLKARPELDRLYNNLVREARPEGDGMNTHRQLSSIENEGAMTFDIFERFMREKQNSGLSEIELKDIFDRYSVDVSDLCIDGQDLPVAPSSDQVSFLLPIHPRASSSSLNIRELDSDSSPFPPSALFGTSSNMSRVMTLERFTSFLLSADNPTCLEPRSGLSTQEHGFTHHPESNITMFHRLSEISHDMTRPLSDYYISSSHNTYLIGHQLYGESTVEGYVRAFLGGCRSVELDIFDTDTGPQIFHGKTLTSKVPLREVCEAIMSYGFVASQYPLIISAEIHCGLVGQGQLVEIMKDVFGDRLVRRNENGAVVGHSQSKQSSNLEGGQILFTSIDKLPSPEELKGRILVKAKNVHLTDIKNSLPLDRSSSTSSTNVLGGFDASTSSTSDTDAMFDGALSSRQNSDRSEHSNKGVLQRVKSHGKSDSTHAPSSYSPHRGSAKAGRSTSSHSQNSSLDDSKAKPKMSPDLLSLLVYTVGVKYRGINKKEMYKPEEMFSLSEKMANKMLKVGMIDLIKHTRDHLVRIYPRGTRVRSTNYEPHRYWSAGTQLVAINWQTIDLGYMINHAMFQRNGGSGYLLKPLSLRIPHKEMLSKQTQHHFNVTIISAQHLPAPRDTTGREFSEKSIMNPYVQVTLHVPDWPTPPSPYLISSALTSVNNTASVFARPTSPSSPSFPSHPPLSRGSSYRTGAVKNNGFNPVWEEKLRIPFSCVGDMKDLIFVRFAVRHSEREDVEPLAQFCASLGCLQHGYRHLPLHDSQMSQYLFSTLFVRIDIS